MYAIRSYYGVGGNHVGEDKGRQDEKKGGYQGVQGNHEAERREGSYNFV